MCRLTLRSERWQFAEAGGRASKKSRMQICVHRSKHRTPNPLNDAGQGSERHIEIAPRVKMTLWWCP